MSQFRRIKLEFAAAAGEGGKVPRLDVPTARSAPRAQGTSQKSPRFANATPPTTPRPRPKTASEGEILVAVMGVTGSGKSHFCRAATGDDGIGVGDGLEPCTQKPATHQLMLGKMRVILIDTPGFNSYIRDDAEILADIAAELCETYQHDRKLSGVIYFHRISDPRVEGSAVKQFKMFHELCGDDSSILKNVILVTNRWDCVESEEVGIRRQMELESNPRYWKPMCQEGSRVTRFEGTTWSALELIRLLVHNTPVPLKIQREIVDGNKPIAETSAGRFIREGVIRSPKEHEQILTAIMETKLTLQNKDEDMHALLKGELEHSKKAIAELHKQQVVMKANTKRVLALLDEERKMRKEERGRIENVMIQLKECITAGAQAGTVADNKQVQQVTRNPRVNTENRPPSKKRLDQEIDELVERQVEQRKILEGLEQRARYKCDLMNAGYDPRDRRKSSTIALNVAARNHHDLRFIRALLAKGADPASDISRSSLNPFQKLEYRSALHVAAEVGNTDAVGIFIESSDAEVDLEDKSGNTALIWAAENGHVDVVNMLLARGANPDARNKFGSTPLMKAARWGRQAVVRLLLSQGAELDLANHNGYTALTYSAERGDEAIVYILLMNGADSKPTTNLGESAFTLATKAGHDRVSHLLRLHATGIALEVPPSLEPEPPARPNPEPNTCFEVIGDLTWPKHYPPHFRLSRS